MKPSLIAPLKDSLAEVADEAALRRGWDAVRAHRSRRRTSMFVFAIVPVAATIALIVWLQARPDQRRMITSGGTSIPAVVGTADAPATLELADGSKIDVARGGAVAVTDDRRRKPAMRVDAGTARFAVRGSDAWTVDAGPARVLATRAVFAVARSKTAVSIEVFEGTILLDAPSAAMPQRELAAGQRVELPLAIVAAAPTDAAAPTGAATPTGEMTTAPATAGPLAPSTPAELAPPPMPSNVVGRSPPTSIQQDVHTRTAAPPSTATDRTQTPPIRKDLHTTPTPPATTLRTDDVAILFAAADVARRAGRTSDAITALTRIINEHARHAEAPTAAFTLGRVLLDEAKDPRAAAIALERAVALQLPAGLRELAHARLVEAHARAGNHPAAQTWADRYRTRYPTGSHLAEVAAWLR